MKSFACFLALGLAGCVTTPNLTYAPSDLEAGYPVFVHSDGSDCRFQVQDMRVSRKQLSEWMMDLPDKSRRIDLVVAIGAEPCAMSAHSTVRNAGFIKIAFRRQGAVSYPSGLPPA
ncbi:hypothetical protein K3172_03505 [Qipengyuania sp. 6B39]|uniref:hypothetical protein n=1 Tax=Qipengyuania proteolytica TaxID=2867239 RepID=UPI001C89B1C7|nr:hypothetical protein [Qipengyuania proteolytica]MBX7494921.1 hypothetical protein [Qipengyuania proteolytica]